MEINVFLSMLLYIAAIVLVIVFIIVGISTIAHPVLLIMALRLASISNKSTAKLCNFSDVAKHLCQKNE